MDTLNTQTFTLESDVLYFDILKQTILCKTAGLLRNRWIKKLEGINEITAVSEDDDKFYISCETDTFSGIFLAIEKSDGATAWDIPGNAYFHILYDGFIYIIFIDSDSRYYLLKAETGEGKKIWHHVVREDLKDYSFTEDVVTLGYGSGRIERLSANTGLSLD